MEDNFFECDVDDLELVAGDYYCSLTVTDIYGDQGFKIVNINIEQESNYIPVSNAVLDAIFETAIHDEC